MEAKELRIGNYIQHSEDSIWGCIDKFYGDEVYIDDWHYGTTELKECEPIPLNDEWLLKFGFEDWDIDIYTMDLMNNNFYVLFDELEIIAKNIKYVHQLQNLYFALTGNELKTV